MNVCNCFDIMVTLTVEFMYHKHSMWKVTFSLFVIWWLWEELLNLVMNTYLLWCPALKILIKYWLICGCSNKIVTQNLCACLTNVWGWKNMIFVISEAKWACRSGREQCPDVDQNRNMSGVAYYVKIIMIITVYNVVCVYCWKNCWKK